MTLRWTEKGTGYNSGLAKGGLACFVETFVLKQTFVLRMNFSAKNSALRQDICRLRPWHGSLPQIHEGKIHQAAGVACGFVDSALRWQLSQINGSL
jgi:hypothetical protein